MGNSSFGHFFGRKKVLLLVGRKKGPLGRKKLKKIHLEVMYHHSEMWEKERKNEYVRDVTAKY